MNKKILAIALIAPMLAVVVAPAFGTSDPQLKLKEAKIKDDGTTVKFEVEVAGSIPKAVSDGKLFGYVALTSDFQDMLALTTHNGIDDNGADPNGPFGMHTHIVDVVGTCASGLKVSASGFSPAQSNVKVEGKETSVKGVDSSLTGTFTGAVASFSIHLEGSDVCVVVTDVITAE